jgi:hypothetical protein
MQQISGVAPKFEQKRRSSTAEEMPSRELMMLRILITASMFSLKRSSLQSLMIFQIPKERVPVIQDFRSRNYSGVRWLSVSNITGDNGEVKCGITTSLSLVYFIVAFFRNA